MSEPITGLEKNECVTWKKLDANRSVMLDLESGRYYTLNHTATVVWELMGKNTSVDYLAQCLTQRFAVDAAAAIRDIEELVAFLSDRGFVRKLSGPAAEATAAAAPQGTSPAPYSKPAVEEHEAVQEIAAAGTGGYGGGSHYWYPN